MVKAQNAFNIADFRSVVGQKGISQPNKFRLRLFMPVGLESTLWAGQFGLAGPDIETVRFLEYWVAGVSYPASGLTTVAAHRYGYGASEKRPYGLNYQDLSVNILCDEHSEAWKLFYNWINLIINARMQIGISGITGHVNSQSGGLLAYSPYELSYKVEYISDIQIHTMTKEGEIDKLIVFREAYPISIGGVDFDWSRNNSLTTLPIQFAYTDTQVYFGSQIIQ